MRYTGTHCESGMCHDWVLYRTRHTGASTSNGLAVSWIKRLSVSALQKGSLSPNLPVAFTEENHEDNEIRTRRTRK